MRTKSTDEGRYHELKTSKIRDLEWLEATIKKFRASLAINEEKKVSDFLPDGGSFEVSTYHPKRGGSANHRIRIALGSGSSSHILLPPKITILAKAPRADALHLIKDIIISEARYFFSCPHDFFNDDKEKTRKVAEQLISSLKASKIRVTSARGIYYARTSLADYEEKALTAFSFRS